MRFRAIAIAVVALGLFSQFQNCGKTPGSTAAVNGRISPQSPFYDQRVRLDVPEQAFAKATTAEDVSQQMDDKSISILMHNSCAMEACKTSQEPESSISCQILEKHEVLDKLENDLQAYPWTLDKKLPSEEFEAMLRTNNIDDQCIVGVSFDISYQVKAYTSNDPGTPSQYYHQTIKGPSAYDFFYSQSLSQVYVAVIDTGIEAAHEDINYSGQNIRIGTSCTELCHWHGNFVSGIISAKRNNSKGGHGIAPNAYIYAFQIGDQYGNLTTTELVNALQVSNSYSNIDIVNLSLGGSGLYDYSVQDAIMTTISKGRVVVVAAGNNGRDIAKYPFYPAAFNFDGQITVAAASPKDVVAKTLPATGAQISSAINRDTFSNYNSALVHIAAPGSNIYSTTLNNTYGVYSGTSFSAPMVTGALALVKGYLKGKGYDVSPQMLRSILFEGSTSVPTLSVTTNGIEEKMVQNNRFLDLDKLKATVQSFAASYSSTPSRIEMVSSSVSTVGAQQQVNIRVDVRDNAVGGTLTLKAYTNSAFLTESFTGYSCQITAARQFCDITISYNQLLANPEVYLRIVDSTDKLVSDLRIPKVAINFGNKATAPIKGEIIAAYHFDKSFQIEGWACLKGFTDSLKIEVRNNVNTGAPYQILSTNRQARGSYFLECNAAEISFGFRYVVPESDIISGVSKKVYFRAVHEETGKTLDLPVYTYQPTYEDTAPATYTDSVFIDKNLADRDLQIQFTSREFSNFNLTLKGSACYKNSYKPGTFTLALAGPANDIEFLKMIPEIRTRLPASLINQQVAAIQEGAASYASISKSVGVDNPVIKAIDNRGLLGNQQLHSDIYNSFRYEPNGGGADAGFLLYIEDLLKLDSGLLTITPDIELNDGCNVPSGFNVTVDIRPYIQSIRASIGLSYRSDVYTNAQIRALPEFAAYQTLLNLPETVVSNFTSLQFNHMAFDFYTESSLGAQKKSVFMNKNLFEQLMLSEHLSKVPTITKGSRTIAMSEASRYQFNSNYMKYNHGIISNSPLTYGLPAANTNFWNEPLALVLAESANLTVQAIYTSDLLPLPANRNRFFAVVTYNTGTHFGEINTDFKLQFRYSATGPWYDADINPLSSGQVGVLTATGVFPVASPTSVQMRLLSNGKNAFKLTSIGFMTE